MAGRQGRLAISAVCTVRRAGGRGEWRGAVGEARDGIGQRRQQHQPHRPLKRPTLPPHQTKHTTPLAPHTRAHHWRCGAGVRECVDKGQS